MPVCDSCRKDVCHVEEATGLIWYAVEVVVEVVTDHWLGDARNEYE
jgi:hypothetical protein